MNSRQVEKKLHHQRYKLCTTRPAYRQGRKPTAVKVYTVNDESLHLLVHGVPAIAVVAELEALCQRFGSIELLEHLPDYPTEKFCEVYHVKFHTFQSARFAKRQMDDRTFYGGILHVCYAPELETAEDTRRKFSTRIQEINRKLSLSVQQRVESQIVSARLSGEMACSVPQSLSIDSSTSKEVPQKSVPVSQRTKVASIPPVKRIVYRTTSQGPDAPLTSDTANDTKRLRLDNEQRVISK